MPVPDKCCNCMKGGWKTQAERRNHAAGILWACKRLNSVKELQVWEGAAVRCLADTHNPQLPLHCLRWLEVNMSEVLGRDNACFAWLLAHAPALTVLSCTVGTMSWLPPLVHLKHLDLTLSGAAGDVCAALTSAKSLVTLRLAAKNISAGVVGVPELHLGHLSALQTPVLQGVSPTELSLSEECLLSVKHAMFDSKEWDSAPRNVHMIQTCALPRVSTALPAFFLNLCNLHTVILFVDEAGDVRNLVSLGPLAHVRRLYVQAKKLYLKIPSIVCWQELMVNCVPPGELMLSFDDVQAFASTVSQCCIYYPTLRGLWCADLCSALSGMGISWSIEGSTADKTNVYFPESCNVDFGDCSCGGCLECLKRSLSDDRLQA